MTLTPAPLLVCYGTSTANRNKLHTVKLTVGDLQSYHDRYVTQSGKTSSVASVFRNEVRQSVNNKNI